MPINDELKSNILKSISLSGSADESVSDDKSVIANQNNLNAILDLSSGRPRIHSHRAKQFKLVLSQPLRLASLSAFEIRCALCKRVISYPSWYYEVKYAINHVHYFVCFDNHSPNMVTAKCYRRS